MASDHRQGRARPWRDELRGPCCAAHYRPRYQRSSGRGRARTCRRCRLPWFDQPPGRSARRPSRAPPGTRGEGRPFQAGDPTSGRARPRVRSAPWRRITGRAALVPGGTSSAARAAQRTTGLATSALRGAVALGRAAGGLPWLDQRPAERARAGATFAARRIRAGRAGRPATRPADPSPVALTARRRPLSRHASHTSCAVAIRYPARFSSSPCKWKSSMRSSSP